MPEHATKQRLCRFDDLAPGEARRLDVGKHRIAVVRIGDELYAIGDRCTHANISLAEGEVHAEDRTIECWKHGSEFSLETGEPLTLPATKPEPVYEVHVDDGDIVVVIPE
ncbi:MAG TPA: non-heme iron oxygenase ferredoxin subunit [Acidimicrobiales bacterium]|jgi:3-phenylpropionate/trans-cinnamate dioxygenase ferredoxin subunit|nr:non-heme iron oxygenase ferredoxin subunit [Acidimicrobiales bacterium]